MREIEVELSCDLTERELQHRAQQLGAAVVELDAVGNAKREAMKAYTQQSDEVQERMRILSRAIRTRTEKRLVTCAVQFHTPREAHKRITRMDTGELVREEAMTLEECQQHLFEVNE